MTRRIITFVAAAAIGMASSRELFACGACIEDRIAATYDYVVINEAIDGHRQVVFVAIDGPIRTDKIGMRITTAAKKVRGVHGSTLRTSASPGAFSFALDGGRDPAVAVAEFRRAIADPMAKLTLLRIMRGGVLREPK